MSQKKKTTDTIQSINQTKNSLQKNALPFFRITIHKSNVVSTKENTGNFLYIIVLCKETKNIIDYIFSKTKKETKNKEKF